MNRYRALMSSGGTAPLRSPSDVTLRQLNTDSLQIFRVNTVRKCAELCESPVERCPCGSHELLYEARNEHGAGNGDVLRMNAHFSPAKNQIESNSTISIMATIDTRVETLPQGHRRDLTRRFSLR